MGSKKKTTTFVDPLSGRAEAAPILPDFSSDTADKPNLSLDTSLGQKNFDVVDKVFGPNVAAADAALTDAYTNLVGELGNIASWFLPGVHNALSNYSPSAVAEKIIHNAPDSKLAEAGAFAAQALPWFLLARTPTAALGKSLGIGRNIANAATFGVSELGPAQLISAALRVGNKPLKFSKATEAATAAGGVGAAELASKAAEQATSAEKVAQDVGAAKPALDPTLDIAPAYGDFFDTPTYARRIQQALTGTVSDPLAEAKMADAALARAQAEHSQKVLDALKRGESPPPFDPASVVVRATEAKPVESEIPGVSGKLDATTPIALPDETAKYFDTQKALDVAPKVEPDVVAVEKVPQSEPVVETPKALEVAKTKIAEQKTLAASNLPGKELDVEQLVRTEAKRSPSKVRRVDLRTADPHKAVRAAINLAREGGELPKRTSRIARIAFETAKRLEQEGEITLKGAPIVRDANTNTLRENFEAAKANNEVDVLQNIVDRLEAKKLESESLDMQDAILLADAKAALTQIAQKNSTREAIKRAVAKAKEDPTSWFGESLHPTHLVGIMAAAGAVGLWNSKEAAARSNVEKAQDARDVFVPALVVGAIFHSTRVGELLTSASSKLSALNKAGKVSLNLVEQNIRASNVSKVERNIIQKAVESMRAHGVEDSVDPRVFERNVEEFVTPLEMDSSVNGKNWLTTHQVTTSPEFGLTNVKFDVVAENAKFYRFTLKTPNSQTFFIEPHGLGPNVIGHVRVYEDVENKAAYILEVQSSFKKAVRDNGKLIDPQVAWGIINRHLHKLKARPILDPFGTKRTAGAYIGVTKELRGLTDEQVAEMRKELEAAPKLPKDKRLEKFGKEVNDNVHVEKRILQETLQSLKKRGFEKIYLPDGETLTAIEGHAEPFAPLIQLYDKQIPKWLERLGLEHKGTHWTGPNAADEAQFVWRTYNLDKLPDRIYEAGYARPDVMAGVALASAGAGIGGLANAQEQGGFSVEGALIGAALGLAFPALIKLRSLPKLKRGIWADTPMGTGKVVSLSESKIGVSIGGKTHVFDRKFVTPSGTFSGKFPTHSWLFNNKEVDELTQEVEKVLPRDPSISDRITSHVLKLRSWARKNLLRGRDYRLRGFPVVREELIKVDEITRSGITIAHNTASDIMRYLKTPDQVTRFGKYMVAKDMASQIERGQKVFSESGRELSAADLQAYVQKVAGKDLEAFQKAEAVYRAHFDKMFAERVSLGLASKEDYVPNYFHRVINRLDAETIKVSDKGRDLQPSAKLSRTKHSFEHERGDVFTGNYSPDVYKSIYEYTTRHYGDVARIRFFKELLSNPMYAIRVERKADGTWPDVKFLAGQPVAHFTKEQLIKSLHIDATVSPEKHYEGVVKELLGSSEDVMFYLNKELLKGVTEHFEVMRPIWVEQIMHHFTRALKEGYLHPISTGFGYDITNMLTDAQRVGMFLPEAFRYVNDAIRIARNISRHGKVEDFAHLLAQGSDQLQGDYKAVISLAANNALPDIRNEEELMKFLRAHGIAGAGLHEREVSQGAVSSFRTGMLQKGAAPKIGGLLSTLLGRNTIRLLRNMREDVLRIATTMALIDLAKTNPKRLEEIVKRLAPVGGEARKEWFDYFKQLKDLKRPDLAISKLSRDVMIDYGDFSPFEQRWLRGMFVPFYAFLKANTRDLTRLAINDPKTFFTHVAIYYGATTVYNRTFFPYYEQNLPKYQQARPHIWVPNIWSAPGSSPVVAIGFDGALSDFFQNIMAYNFQNALGDVIEGRKSLEEIAAEFYRDALTQELGKGFFSLNPIVDVVTQDFGPMIAQIERGELPTPRTIEAAKRRMGFHVIPGAGMWNELINIQLGNKPTDELPELLKKKIYGRFVYSPQ